MHRSLDFTAEHLTLRAIAAIGQNSCIGRVALHALERCDYRVVTDWRRVRVELVAEGRWVDVQLVASSQAGMATSRPRRRAFQQIRQRHATRALSAVCACRAFRDQ